VDVPELMVRPIVKLTLAVTLALSVLPCATLRASATQGIAGQRPRAVIDLSGVDTFLELTALLEQDKEPTPEQWDRLLSTPGYAVLIKREFGRDFFIDRFKLAFMPSKKSNLEAQMKKDTGFWAQFLPHYLHAKEMRKDIERRAAETRTLEFAEEAINRAKAFLPELHTNERPSIAFVVFAPDSRGYDPVVIDILYANDREDFLNIVAHEFHHWYRARLAADLTRDQDVLWVLQQVQLEGIADLINVPAWMKRPAETLSASDRQYIEFYGKSPEIIRAMNDLFVRMQDNPADRRDLGWTLRTVVPRSGHPTGYYMAETIVGTLGKGALIRTVSNPFAFFRVYNDAAGKKGNGTPLFSKKAMDFLRSLEKRYAQ
jgi:hypothetical protein